ncbi:MAG: alternative ribosome rescue aminoacyl-tRNA hydrolase ArfB [Solirubrobacterales bacterium]
MPEQSTNLRITRSVSIPLAEIDLRVSRSSGPGGQHANKTESRVEAVFSVEDTSALGPNQKRRVIAKLGPVVRTVSQDERSQLRNRELALLRMKDKLEGALHVEKRRVATKPSKAAREKRLTAKRVRSSVKTNRRRPSSDE